ncbi:MAG TPA: protein kinase [Polyangiales bacterium]|nr:protein kinase [Polyangiales bacterium]
MTPGDTVVEGKYKIVRLIGQGGMGSVYEAEHCTSGRRVAIKCLRADRIGDAVALQRSKREAHMIGALEHPNVVSLLDVHENEQNVLLIMEYLEGQTLRERFEAERLPVHELVTLLLPVIRAVGAAHKKGYLHRDIKPENIFLARVADRDEPVPKVLDFGIGRPTITHTELTEAPIGTPLYMSLEQMRGAADIDARTDVYAFGVVLYEGLTGTRPYQADNYFEYCTKLTTTEPIAPKALRADIPLSLSRLVLWTLEKDREQRVPTLEDLARELEPFSTARLLQREIEQSMPLPAATAPTLLQAPPPPAAGEPSSKPTLRAFALTPARIEAPAPRRTGYAITTALAIACAGIALSLRQPPRLEPTPTQESPAPEDAGVPAPVPTREETSPPEPDAVGPAQEHHQLQPAPPVTPTKPPERKQLTHRLPPPVPTVDAKLQQLRNELMECSELSAPVREVCRADYRKQIAERERDLDIIRGSKSAF